jgi:hypothetical protein
MKKTLLLLGFSMLFIAAYSQNLTFNQVLTFSGEIATSSTSGNQVDGPVYSVPAGKIWKIESLYMSNYSGRIMNYKLNGILLGFNSVDPLNMIQFPIWLKASDTVQPIADGNGVSVGYFISIIEFNQP